jgi:hypothetical protein
MFLKIGIVVEIENVPKLEGLNYCLKRNFDLKFWGEGPAKKRRSDLRTNK